MSIYTDIAGEIFQGQKGTVPQGVHRTVQTVGEVTLNRLEITKTGLARPRGVYITAEMPHFAYIDERNEVYTSVIAAQLAQLLPKEGQVLVVGLGNRALVADALGPLTVDSVFVTRGSAREVARGLKLREVTAFAAEVEGKTGIEAAAQVHAMVRALGPAAIICVDALCALGEGHLGCTVQITNTGIAPGSGVGAHKSAITQRTMGVPVIAVGVPTVMDAADLCGGQRGLIVTPKEVDFIVKRSASVLALAINRALQKELSFGEISFLTS